MKVLFKRFLPLFLIVMALLLLPFIAMQFSTDINWTIFDFLVAGFLMSITGVAIEFILRKSFSKKQKVMFCLLILLLFIIIWIELSVGIFN